MRFNFFILLLFFSSLYSMDLRFNTDGKASLVRKRVRRVGRTSSVPVMLPPSPLRYPASHYEQLRNTETLPEDLNESEYFLVKFVNFLFERKNNEEINSFTSFISDPQNKNLLLNIYSGFQTINMKLKTVDGKTRGLGFRCPIKIYEFENNIAMLSTNKTNIDFMGKSCFCSLVKIEYTSREELNLSFSYIISLFLSYILRENFNYFLRERNYFEKDCYAQVFIA